ncbi:MAG: DUF5518 domain-containing protein [Halovenus sp.]
MSDRTTWSNIVLGGFVIYFATPLIPLAPAFGGGLAGYLEDGTGQEGLRVGLFAGSLAYVALAVTIFIAGNLLLAAVAATDSGLGELLAALRPTVLLSAILGSLLYVVGLAALGGWLAPRVRGV